MIKGLTELLLLDVVDRRRLRARLEKQLDVVGVVGAFGGEPIDVTQLRRALDTLVEVSDQRDQDPQDDPAGVLAYFAALRGLGGADRADHDSVPAQTHEGHHIVIGDGLEGRITTSEIRRGGDQVGYRERLTIDNPEGWLDGETTKIEYAEGGTEEDVTGRNAHVEFISRESAKERLYGATLDFRYATELPSRSEVAGVVRNRPSGLTQRRFYVYNETSDGAPPTGYMVREYIDLSASSSCEGWWVFEHWMFNASYKVPAASDNGTNGSQTLISLKGRGSDTHLEGLTDLPAVIGLASDSFVDGTYAQISYVITRR